MELLHFNTLASSHIWGFPKKSPKRTWLYVGILLVR